MLWRRSAPPLVMPAVSAVPDTEILRRAALQASWQRGRWVARRRVVWRWLLWVLTRYLLPALATIALAAGLWLALAQHTDDPVKRPKTPTVSAALAVHPAPLPVPVPVRDDYAELEAQFSPEGEVLVTPLPLRLETAWAAAATTRAASAPATLASSAGSFPTPILKPENWLHSKEP